MTGWIEGLAGLAAGRIGCKGVHQQHKTVALVVKVFGGIIGSHFRVIEIWIFDRTWHKKGKKRVGLMERISAIGQQRFPVGLFRAFIEKDVRSPQKWRLLHLEWRRVNPNPLKQANIQWKYRRSTERYSISLKNLRLALEVFLFLAPRTVPARNQFFFEDLPQAISQLLHALLQPL
jgi:hypothetical protein